MKDKHQKGAAPAATKPAEPKEPKAAPAPKLLAQDASLAEVIAAVNEILSRGGGRGRDRGPTSTRTMTASDADRVILGDLKDLSHGKAAAELGLSYGQVYSARKGFTFKAEYQRGEKAKRAEAVAK